MLRAMRRGRERVFGDLDEPQLIVLCELAATPQPLSVSSLCYATGLPQTTALRRVYLLEERGLVVFERDAYDARRRLAKLTERGRTHVEHWFTCAMDAVRDVG
ncbi:MAG: helix-turn-helix domain-containing protein [Pseudomonadota bacterium]